MKRRLRNISADHCVSNIGTGFFRHDRKVALSELNTYSQVQNYWQYWMYNGVLNVQDLGVVVFHEFQFSVNVNLVIFQTFNGNSEIILGRSF